MTTIPEDEIGELHQRMSQLENSMVVSATSSSSFASTQSDTHATAFHASSSPSKSCILDFGASDHIAGQSSLFSFYSVNSRRDKVKVAYGTPSSISRKGSVHVSPTLSLSSVLHVLKFTTNLLSISHLTKDLNCLVTLFHSHCVFQDLDSKEMIGSGREANRLYLQHIDVVQSSFHSLPKSNNSYVANKNSLLQWHKRMDHLSLSSLKHLFPHLFFLNPSMNLNSEICQLSKHVHNSYPLSVNNSLYPFAIVHFDVWGPFPTSSLFGYTYFITCIDDYSRCMWVYLMKAKDEVGSISQFFHKMIQTQFGAFIKVLHSDNGGSIFQVTCGLILPLLELNTKPHV